jgi:transposase InsO family protein
VRLKWIPGATPQPPSQTWRTFLNNHAKNFVSVDFFLAPTMAFQLLFVFLILDHDRRRPLHFTVTSLPTEEWTARQLLEAFPWDTAPRYLLRDRDAIYGHKFSETAHWMGIHEVLTAPRSPWQNAHVERLIGSLRRECLDHVIVFDEIGLRRILKIISSTTKIFERTSPSTKMRLSAERSSLPRLAG